MDRNNFTALIFSLIIFFAVIIFLVLPKVSNLMYLRSSLSAGTFTITQMQQVFSDFNNLKSQYDYLQSEVNAANVMIPRGMDYPVLLQQLNNLADCGGMTMTNSSIATKKVNDNYTQLGVSEDLDGNFLSFQQYLSCVENSPRFFEVTSAHFTAGFKSMVDSAKFTVTMQGYYQNQ